MGAMVGYGRNAEEGSSQEAKGEESCLIPSSLPSVFDGLD